MKTDVIVVGDVPNSGVSLLEQLKAIGVKNPCSALSNIEEKLHINPNDIFFIWDSEDGYKLKIIHASNITSNGTERTIAEQVIEGNIFGGLL